MLPVARSELATVFVPVPLAPASPTADLTRRLCDLLGGLQAPLPPALGAAEREGLDAVLRLLEAARDEPGVSVSGCASVLDHPAREAALDSLICGGKDEPAFRGALLLIKWGFLDRRETGAEGSRWLHHLARHGQEPQGSACAPISLTERFRAFAEAGVQLDSLDPLQHTPLMSALVAKNIVAGKALIEAGAEVTRRDAEARTPLHLAAELDCLEIAEALVRRGACVEAHDTYFETPLHHAARANALSVAEFLLDMGAAVIPGGGNAHWNPISPLHLAAENGSAQTLHLLLKADPFCDVNHSACRGGETPLHAAAEGGFLEAVDCLLAARGVDVNAVADTSGEGSETPLQRAAEGGHLEVVVRLLDAGADIDFQDSLGQTALHLACHYGCVDVADYLKARGADQSLRDRRNRSAEEIATEFLSADSDSLRSN